MSLGSLPSTTADTICVSRPSFTFLSNHLTFVGRTNGTKLDVGESHRGIRVLGLDVLRVAGAVLAGATGNARLRGISISGVGAVEPHHARMVVVPDAHYENHLRQGFAHAAEAAVLRENILIAKGLLLGRAEVRGDRVTRHAGNVGDRVGNHLTVLDVETLDFGKSTTVSAVSGNELGHYGHLEFRINDLSRAIEGLIAHAERIEVTAIRIASACIAAFRVSATAGITAAHGL